MLEAIIADLEASPDLKWVVGVPVSSGLLVAAEGDVVRFRIAPDVTLIGNDAKRILMVLAASIADSPERLERVLATAPGAGARRARRSPAVSLEVPSVPMDAVSHLIRRVAECAELVSIVRTDPRVALMIVADGGVLKIDVFPTELLAADQQHELARLLGECIAQELPSPTTV